jgi:enoyl-CoA hydratase/carnithine racemase
MSGRVYSIKEGAIAWLVVDQEARRNALTAEMWRQLPVVAAELDADPDVRVIVLRGAGEQAFVSGADISEFSDKRMGAAAEQYEAENARAFGALQHVKKPTLTMIHGFCIGGGVAISVSTDLRYAAEDALFAVPAGKLGLAYPLPGIETLIELLGASRAKELFYTGRRFDAHEALRMGLVNAVFPKAELEARVREIAGMIAENAPLTLRAVKVSAIELQKPKAERDEALLRDASAACFASADYAEGVRAFLDKRKPRFSGR